MRMNAALVVAAGLLLAAANSLLASESYAGYPGKWVVAELHGYVAEGHRTATDGDVRRPEHYYGIAAAPPESGVASWHTLPVGTLVVVPRGHGYLDGDPQYHSPEQRVLPVDDAVPLVTEKAKETQRLHLGVRCRSKAAADRLKGKRVRVFVVDRGASSR